MKISLVLFLVLNLLVISCKKSDDSDTSRRYNRIKFAFDKAVYAKNEEIFVAVRFLKAPGEELDLRLNDIRGTLLKVQKVDFYGEVYLYKFNGVALNEAVVRFLIGGAEVKKTPIRFASEMSLNSLWSKLTKPYIENQNLILNFTSGEISMIHMLPASIYEKDVNGNLVIIFNKEKSMLKIGSFGEGVIDSCYIKPFIKGLEGAYILIFNADGTLFQIRVTQKYRDFIYPNRTLSDINQKLSQIYGKSVSFTDSWHTKVYVYRSEGFEITTTQLLDGTISSIITKL